jgi:hypothetical protein
MSLFDAYDPATYGPSQGGLIDQLLAMTQPGQQFAPGQGFPSNPMDANASANAPAPAPQPQAPQNAPIAVGNVNMPRIGSGFPAASDDTAQAPQPAPQQPAPTAAPSPADTLSNHASAAWQSLRHGGGLIGGLSAAITGQRDDPQNDALQMQQAALQKQVAGLVAAGVPKNLAQLAVINPKAAESIIPQYVGADKNKFVKIGQDGLGREQYGFVNEQDKTITPVKGPAGNGGDNDGALGDMSKTGAAYLATLPPQVRGTVQAMVEGRVAPPSSFALSKPYWQNMLAAAQNVDPTFDATQWSGRVAGVKDFTAGKSAESVKSLNQAIAHIESLMGSATALNNGNYPALNYLENKASEAMGSGTQGSFRTNANAVADEVGKFFKAGNLSDHEIQEWKANISENMSPAQQRAQIGKLAELMRGGIDALEEKRLNSIGPIAAEKQGPLVKPAGQAALKRIDSFVNAGNGATGNTTKSGVQWSVVQ